MATFSVSDFYVLPTRQEVSARRIDKSRLAEFWKACPLGGRIGVYVLCVRSGRGCLPWYVGKTYASYAGEVFQPHKIEKYNDCLAKIKRGTPGLVFLYKQGTGRPSNDTILEMEKEYINKGFERNSRLLNDLGYRKPTYTISGLTDAGRPSKVVQQFKQIFGI